MFPLGQRARDKVTGLEGIITAHAEYLHGCGRFCIAPPVKDGEYKEPHWFDEPQVEILEPDS